MDDKDRICHICHYILTLEEGLESSCPKCQAEHYIIDTGGLVGTIRFGNSDDCMSPLESDGLAAKWREIIEDKKFEQDYPAFAAAKKAGMKESNVPGVIHRFRTKKRQCA